MERKALLAEMTVAMIALVALTAAGCASDNQQQKAGDPQQKAEGANSNLLAKCADGRGSHQQKVLEQDSNGKKLVFVRGSQVGSDSSPDIAESVGSGPPSIKMYAVNADGTGLAQVTKGTATKYGITDELPDNRGVTINWSYDGRKILSIEPPESERYADLSGRYGNLACSLDGNKVAFTTEEPASSASAMGTNATDSDLYVYLKNAGTKNLGDEITNGNEYRPAWSPNSEKIAFMSNGVYVADADGSNQRYLAKASTATWSPDSKKIAFISDGDVYLISVDGTDRTQLTNNVRPGYPYDTVESYAPWASLFFSPDGTKIAFLSNDSDIYVVNTDGTGLTRLTNNDAWEAIVTWVGTTERS